MDIEPLRCHRPRPELAAGLAGASWSAETLAGAVRSGKFLKEPEPCLYLWQVAAGASRQIGVVCAMGAAGLAGVEAAEGRPAEEAPAALGRLRALGAQTVPLELRYPDNYAIDVLVSAAHAAEPAYDLELSGARHRLWRVARPAALDAFAAAFTTVPAARAVTGAGLVRACQAGGADVEGYRFMCALFPAGGADGAGGQEGGARAPAPLPLPEGLLIQRFI